MNGAALDAGRTVAVVRLGEVDNDPVLEGTDVAVIVLEADSDLEPEFLREVRAKVQVVMGVVLGQSEVTGGPALACLREYADIIAHAGNDREIVPDVVAILTRRSPSDRD